MGKIFGISKLPVSTIDEALKPSQDLVAKVPSKRILTRVEDGLQRTPLKDVFVKKPKNPSTVSK